MGVLFVLLFFKKMPGSLEQVSELLKSNLLAKCFPSPWTNLSCFHLKVSSLKKASPPKTRQVWLSESIGKIHLTLGGTSGY